MKLFSFFLLCGVLFLSVSCRNMDPDYAAQQERISKLKRELGRKIFFDKNLSNPAGYSCADCHSPEAGFGNPDITLPVARGVNPDRFSNRNTLSTAYACYIPGFHYDYDKRKYVGGMFWDGSVVSLVEQAKVSFLHPLQMANSDKGSVVDKIREARYAHEFVRVFGEYVLHDTEMAFHNIAEAVAEYERSYVMNKFNSKYDYYVNKKVEFSEQEKRGFNLFRGKANCSICHYCRIGEDGAHPMFTDYRYENIGVPKNGGNPFYYLSEDLNPDGIDYVDSGLGGVINKPGENGKFKIPTLRNVAKTGPYMHNGIFKTLREVVSFINTRDIGPWPDPEVPDNINRRDLGDLMLSESEVDDIVVFLHTLSDDFDRGLLKY